MTSPAALPSPTTWASSARWARTTLTAGALAPLGLPLVNPFRGDGPVHRGVLTIDVDANLPGGTTLLVGGAEHEVLVRQSSAGMGDSELDVRTLAIKVPDLYGQGHDQDLLLASSGDGAPLHHLLLPSAEVGDRLLSSLWLYLAGNRPLLFGVLPRTAPGRGGFEVGDSLPFAVAGPVGRFRRIGELSLTQVLPEQDAAKVRFDARHDGGGLRALPPTRLYREEPRTAVRA